MGQSTSTQGRSAYADGAVQRRGMAEMGGVQSTTSSSSASAQRRPQAQQQAQSQHQTTAAATTATSAQDTVGRSYPESGSVATLPPYPGPATATSSTTQQHNEG